MANAPKVLEKKITTVLQAWRQFRPDKTFSGLTLEEFEAIVKPSQDVRKKMGALETQLQSLIATRNTCDRVTLDVIQKVASSVKGDLEEGDDGGFYGALGYVRKSERKCGLVRRKKPAPEA